MAAQGGITDDLVQALGGVENTEKPVSTRSRTKLAEACGVGSVEAFMEFIQGPLFQDPFQELFVNHIKPLQDEAREKGRDRARSMNATTVWAILEIRRRPGPGTFKTRRRIDKHDWTLAEHYAYCVYQIIENNELEINGVFYGKNISDRAKFNAIWSCIKYQEYEMAESRVQRREKAAAKKEEKAKRKAKAERKAERKAEKQAQKNKATGSDEERDNEGKCKSIKRRKSSHGKLSETSPVQSQLVSKPTGLIAATSDDSDGLVTSDPRHLKKRSDDQPEAFMMSGALLSTAVVPPVAPAAPTALAAPAAAEDLSTEDIATIKKVFESQHSAVANVDDYIRNLYDEKSVIMNKMLLERKSPHDIDLRDRFWQDFVLSSLEEGYNKATTFEEGETPNTAEAIDAVDQIMRDAIEKSGEDNELLPVRQATEADFEAYRQNDLLQDNPRFQRQDNVEACRRLHIENPDNPRYPIMPLNESFQFWQPLAIRMMVKFLGYLGGCLLSDGMGLGKTWEIIGFILWNMDRRTRRIARDSKRKLAFKPSVIVCPPWLTEQWEREILRITGGNITLIRYYGSDDGPADPKRPKILTRQHWIFQGTEPYGSVIILTTPKTLSQRNGPSALAEHRRSKGWTEKKIEASMLVPDKGWERSLHELCWLVAVDEAQSVKNPTSYQHKAVLHLEPDFFVLATGTPDINSIHCNEGYAYFIEPKVQQWSLERLMELGAEGGLNPYLAPDNSEVAKYLRPTVIGLKRYVLDRNLGNASQGLRLAAFYQSCMIRRTHGSVVDGKKISDALPPLTHQRAVCKLTLDQQHILDKYNADPKKRLKFRNREGKVMWHWGCYRIMVLIATWVGFFKIHGKFKAPNTPALLAKQDLLGYIVKLYCQANGVALPKTVTGELELILGVSPKLQMLLRLVHSIVVRAEQNMLVFCTLPAQMVLVFAMLQKLKISAACLHPGQSGEQRRLCISLFNDGQKPMALIGCFKGMGTGLNLHNKCQWVVFLDDPPSGSQGAQAVCRVHRLGVPGPVRLVTLFTPGSVNELQLQNRLKKALAGTIAMMNNDIFGPGENDEMQGNEGATEEMQVGTWVAYHGGIVAAHDQRVADLDLPQLTGIDVPKAIASQLADVPGSFGHRLDDSSQSEDSGEKGHKDSREGEDEFQDEELGGPEEDMVGDEWMGVSDPEYFDDTMSETLPDLD